MKVNRDIVIVKAIIFVFFIVTSFISFGQEICDNGIDDDNDGYIDCYDSDCSGNLLCDDAFIGSSVPNCQFEPLVDTSFSIKLDWETDSNLFPMDNRQTPIVGDIDGDGIPDVIGFDQNKENSLYVFDGTSGGMKTIINSPKIHPMFTSPAIGDVDLDGFGEIFIVSKQNQVAEKAGERRLYCYEHNGVLKFISDSVVGYHDNANLENSKNHSSWNPQLADFNQDGMPEVYLGTHIFNSLTGEFIAKRAYDESRGGLPFDLDKQGEPFSVAIDVLDDGFCANCTGLELVAGNTVYSVDIVNGVLTPEVVAQQHLDDGFTSVVDIDLDGDLDAVVAATKYNFIDSSYHSYVYVWDIQDSNQLGTIFYIDSAVNASVTSTKIGRPNVADFNGDGSLEIGLAGHDVYAVLDFTLNNITELWSKEVVDVSMMTGSTVFDFEGDGKNEVVYKDEYHLFVYNGADGKVLFQKECLSGTRTDFPIVVDVDGDNKTEILCACSGKTGTSGGASKIGRILAFGPDGDDWVTARKVFNQHGYFNVNVNDDLTIPQFQQKHHLGFPANNPVNYSLNSFLKQSTVLTVDGTVAYEASDLSILNFSHNFESCPDQSDSITIEFTIKNIGDLVFKDDVYYSVYDAEPSILKGNLLAIDSVSGNLQIGDSVNTSITMASFCPNVNSYYVVINDRGNNELPFIFNIPDYVTGECEFMNNIDSVIVKCYCDTDEDGVLDSLEIVDGTDPTGPCDLILENQIEEYISSEWYEIDCDGDGVQNGIELNDNTDLFNGCEYLVDNQNISIVSSLWSQDDCDGDGVVNITESEDKTNLFDACSKMKDHITVAVTSEEICDIIIPTVFTPDGDGINDFWNITNARKFSSLVVQVYNRWGQEVYSSVGGTEYNSWDGGNYPIGSYFYIVTYDDNKYRGSVSIVKY